MTRIVSAESLRYEPAGRVVLDEGRLILHASRRIARQAREVATGWETRIRIAVESITAPLRLPGAEDHPEETLAAYARTLLEVIATGSYSVLRLSIQSAAELPDLAREVFESGPQKSRGQLAAFLDLETRMGRMAVDDPMQAAEFFGGMVLGHRQTRALLKLDCDLSPEEIEQIAASAARVFMRAYAPA